MWWTPQTLLVLGLISEAVGSTSSAVSTTATLATPSTSVANATCPSRTANVITHNLPQQCLPSARRSTEVTPSVSPGNATTRGGVPESGTDTRHQEESTSSLAAIIVELNSITSGSGSVASTAPTQSSLSTEAIAVVASPGPEEVSPLDDGKFMSFEDWKKQNLLKAGQSEHLGRDVPVDQLPARKRPTDLQGALDTLGDDHEIELDFSGFLPDGPEQPSRFASAITRASGLEHLDPSKSTPPKAKGRKDAGTTYKERFNYASFDCAANVLKTNREASGASAILGESKDSYMLNVCSADQFLILELCDDISIDTIVLANYEFFSSIFRSFRVSVSDKYPVKADKWKSLGEFEAQNTRDIQAFLIENPLIWARYVRIEFLTHYGVEYYCPISLVRVHGTTMLEEYKHELSSAVNDNDDEPDDNVIDLSEDEVPIPEAIAEPVKHPLSTTETGADISPADSAMVTGSEISVKTTTSPPPDVETVGVTHLSEHGEVCSITSSFERSSSVATPTTSSTRTTGIVSKSIQNLSNSSIVHQSSAAAVANTTSPLAKPGNDISTSENSSEPSGSDSSQYSLSQNASSSLNTTSGLKTNGTATDLQKTLSSTNATTTERQKTSGTTTQSSAAMPTMQESFFKSVQKRLQMLESNSSLSLQYIEDQSRALRDAFNKVEQRQLAKTSAFLDHLNMTVLSELREFRQQYDQLWQSTVIELDVQRERYHQDTEAMNARLVILADELIYQKRLSILQMVIVLVCLALVVFSKGAFNQYLELPLVQSVLARSPSSRWLNSVSIDTPTQSPPATRQGSLRKRGGILKGHRRLQSEDSIDTSLSPNDYGPPTPTSMSYEDASEVETTQGQSVMDDPDFDPSTIERPRTSPPELQTITPPSPDPTDASDHESIGTILHDPGSERQAIAVPRVMIERATPPHKQLSWNLPESNAEM
ncbi:uncharacterized protein AB675_9736 [Cyphellophora attinorum]|uniref:SUN-like protein 1 n=1 Tax=Cyphellophora attinorum TaxID=1664694 RepID=A0A0N1HCI4_9EURO|nr:uncharacterized protein AB675_9736 [Phialophora attinorum]KPI42420.1 hypothetical protein AB675_9736 [Phialophora attinorum]